MTLMMEATKDIIAAEPVPSQGAADGGEQKEHSARDQLARVDNLGATSPRDVLAKEKLYQLATSVGLTDVMRWKPRLVRCE